MYCSNCGRNCTCKPYNPCDQKRTMIGKTPELQQLIDRIRLGDGLNEKEILDLFFSITTGDREMNTVIYYFQEYSQNHNLVWASQRMLADWESSSNNWSGHVAIHNESRNPHRDPKLPREYFRNKPE